MMHWWQLDYVGLLLVDCDINLLRLSDSCDGVRLDCASIFALLHVVAVSVLSRSLDLSCLFLF